MSQFRSCPNCNCTERRFVRLCSEGHHYCTVCGVGWFGEFCPICDSRGSSERGAVVGKVVAHDGETDAGEEAELDEQEDEECEDEPWDSGSEESESHSSGDVYSGSNSSISSSESASSSSSAGVAFVGAIVLVVIALVTWSKSSTVPAPAGERVPAAATSPATDRSAAIADPWAAAVPIPISFTEGASLRITDSNILIFDGIPMPLAFQYADTERPRSMSLTEPSATGRYRLLTLCGSDWCDDTRIVDLRRQRMIYFCCSKSGADQVLWAPDDAYFLVMRSHAGATDFIGIEVATLTMRELRTLDSVFGNESGDIGGPSDLPRSAPRARFDIKSAVWTDSRRVDVDADVFKTRWKETAGNWSGDEEAIERVRISISVPSMKIAVVRREPVS